jgi:sugar phosphate isomerase/epimerase
LAGCSFIHRGLTLHEGVQMAAAFGFRHVDVGVGGLNGHLSPVQAAAQPDVFAAQVRQATDTCGVAPNECFTLNFGPPINDPDAATRKETRNHFAGLARFAANVGFHSLLLLPGPVHPHLGAQRSLDLAVEAFKPLVDLAGAQGVRLHVETDCESCAKTPQAAEELCERVPGLKLTLDYSHFIFLGHAQEEVERLHQYAAHVHVRQAAPGKIVERVDRGRIDYERAVRSLAGCGYAGLFAVEYLACPEADEAGVNIEAETWKMAADLDKILSSEAD